MRQQGRNWRIAFVAATTALVLALGITAMGAARPQRSNLPVAIARQRSTAPAHGPLSAPTVRMNNPRAVAAGSSVGAPVVYGSNRPGGATS